MKTKLLLLLLGLWTLDSGLRILDAQIIFPVDGTTGYYTNRLLYSYAGGTVTNRLTYTNALGRGAFGDTNALHIRYNTNASALRWEWKSAATVLATNTANRYYGAWKTNGTGAAVYGYTLREPTALRPVQVDALGTIVYPDEFAAANSNAFLGIYETGVTGTAASVATTVATTVAAETATTVSAAVSNSISLRNPQHVLGRLINFRKKLRQLDSPIKVFVTTDQATGAITDETTFPNDALVPFYRLLNKEGTISAGGSAEGEVVPTENANVWHVNSHTQPGIFLGTEGYFNLTNGGVLNIARASASTGIAATNVFADRFRFFYLTEPRGDTLTIQTNLAGGGFADLVTIDMAGSGTNGAWYSTNLPPGYYSFRLVNGGGGKTNRLKYIQAYNSRTNAFVTGGTLVNSGGDFWKLADPAECYTNVAIPFFHGLGADLYLLQDMCQTNALTSYPLIKSWIDAGTTNSADVMAFNWFFAHGLTPEADQYWYNATLRAWCETNDWAMFDIAYYEGNPTQYNWWTNHGMFAADGVHFNSNSVPYMNAEVWRTFFADIAQETAYYSPRAFNGPGARYLNGISPVFSGATNTGPFTTTLAGGQNITLDGVDANTPIVKLGNTGKSFIYGTSTGVLGLRGTNHLYLSAKNDTEVYFDLFPSGGLVLGWSGGQDPGVGNVRLAQDLKVTRDVFATNRIFALGGFMATNGAGNTFRLGIDASTNLVWIPQ